MLRSAVIFLAGLSAAAVSADPVEYHGALNGTILSFAIDRTGTEGMLGEFVKIDDGKYDAALETFDLSTGALISFIRRRPNSTGHDYLPFAVLGDHTGLFAEEKTQRRSGLISEVLYETIAPLGANAVTGAWTPPLGPRSNIIAMSRNTAADTTMFLGQQTQTGRQLYLIGSDVTANTFQPRLRLPKRFNDTSLVEYDASTGLAILSNYLSCETCGARLWTADLATGDIQPLVKVGKGFLASMALDQDDRILCTTTVTDFSLELTDLATHATQTIVLPNAASADHAGYWVSYDAVNRLFLVSQPMSSTGFSNLYAYAPDGTLVETIGGLHLSYSQVGFNSTLRKAYAIKSNNSQKLEVIAY